MSSVKSSTARNSSPSRSTARSASKASAQPAQKLNKNGEAKKTQADNFKASDETKEGRHGERTHKNKDGEKTDKNKSDKNKTEENKETKPLEDKLSDLEKQLAELKNNNADQAQKGQSKGGGSCGGGGKKGGGGSCGKGGAQPAQAAQGANAINGQGQGGPDAELQSLAAQVLQGNGGFKNPMIGLPGINTPQSGAASPGVGGIPATKIGGINPMLANKPGMPGIGGNQQLKQVLEQKARQYAQQGFQPQPTTRVLVQSALGYDVFQQAGQQAGANNPQALANNHTAMPPALQNTGGIRF